MLWRSWVDGTVATVTIDKTQFGWRQPFNNTELNQLHAAAFNSRVHSDEEWDWVSQVDRHSMGWVTARLDGKLVGFTNVITDGFVHAWLQDVVVDPAQQRSGIGAELIRHATDHAKAAGCEWLHVDFDEDVADFYLRRCGFQPTQAGLLYLQ